MLQQSEWFRPQPGAVVKELGCRVGIVYRTDGNICDFIPDDQSGDSRLKYEYTEDGQRLNHYIWRFTESAFPENGDKFKGLNDRFHTWPLKHSCCSSVE